MKKNVVFWIGVKNEKYSEKYGGWDWMDISRKTWEYWCERNDCEFVEFTEPVEKDLKKYLEKVEDVLLNILELQEKE